MDVKTVQVNFVVNTVLIPHGTNSPDFLKDVSFHVKFGNVGYCDFSINNSQNSCLV